MTTTAPQLDPPEQIVEFELHEQRYCVGIDAVEEIVRAKTLTELPNAPAAVAGMMNLRGQTTTVLDPAEIFDIAAAQSTDQVVIFDGDDRMGWLVSRVNRVTDLTDDAVEPAPDSPLVSGLINDGEEFVIWVEPAMINGSVSDVDLPD